MEQNQNNEQLASAITKALGYAENGGKPDPNNTQAGKTGELKSIFQFTPDTWKNYAKEILGDENAELTPDAETFVVHKKVSDWLSKGYQPKQIASMWNAGVGEPDAYSGKFSNGSPSKGVNAKYGVQFDVPTYANKVEKYVNEFTGKQGTQPTGAAPTQQTQQKPAGFDPKSQQLTQRLMDIMKSTPTTAPKQPQQQKSLIQLPTVAT